MQALSGEQFADYARRQIAIADELLARHSHDGHLCACGRARPCPVAQSCADTRRHYAGQLAALSDDTVLLPVVQPAETSRRRPWHLVTRLLNSRKHV